MKTAAAIFIVLSFAACELAADDTPATPHGNIPSLTFDLRSRLPSDILPFDQRFNIHGLVADDVRSAEGFYAPRRPDSDCAKLPPADVTALDETEPFGDAGKREVLFSVVKPLDHSTDYCFWFRLTRELDDNQLKTFRSRAAFELDRFFRPIQDLSLDTRRLNELRTSLLTALNDAAPAGTHPAPQSGSMFDPNSADVLRARFTEPVSTIVQAQLNRAGDIQKYCDDRPANLKEIGKATKDIATVLSAINAKRSDQAMKKVLDDHPEARDAIGALRSGKLAQQTDIFCNGGVASPLFEQVWDASSLDAQAAIWKKEITGLDELHEVVETISASSDLQTRLGVTSAEAAQAAKRVGDIQSLIALFAEGLDIVQEELQTRTATIENAVKDAGDEVQSTVPLLTTTMGDFQTQHNFYVSADVGLAFAPVLDTTFTYAGMNIYLRPVNKAAGLSGFKGTFPKRFSFMVGLTLQDVQRAGAFQGVINNRCVIAGAGFRVLNSVRVAGGAVAVRESSENPNVTQTKTRVSPFFSISLDWDVRKTLAGLGSALNIPN